MKLLLDENLPHRLRQELGPHEAFSVQYMGWSGKGNGELLALMKSHGFDLLVTFDKNLAYQQNFRKYDLPVLVLDAEDNTLMVLRELVPVILAKLTYPLPPGVTVVSASN